MNKKKTILFVMHYPPPVNGASFMGKCVRESSLINNTFDTEYINLTTSHTLTSIGKAGISKIFATVGIMFTILRRIRKKKFDLCYMTLTATGAGFYKDLLIVTLLKLFRQNIIFHFHNKGIATAGKNPINNLLYKFAFKGTKTILLSPRLLADINKYVSESLIFYCPNGIPVVPASINAKKHSGKQSRCKILFVSNMLREKGFETLLDACEILKNKGVDFECHFVGSWIDITEEEFNRYTKNKGLSDRVFGEGAKYGEEKFRYFMDSDLFVFPTYYHNETFGLVNLEAMQFRLPVISTFEGGIPDVVEDGVSGFLIHAKNSQALADRLELLIGNTELRFKMGDEGRKRYLELFTVERFENRLTEILQVA